MKKFFAIILAVLIIMTALPLTAGAEGSPELNVSINPGSLVEGGEVDVLVEIANPTEEELTEGMLIVDGEAVQEYDTIAAGGTEVYSGTYTADASALGKDIPVMFTYAGGTLKSSFNIGKKEPTINVGTTVKIDSNTVVKGSEATFTFAIENKGDATMKDINLTAEPLNNGQVLTSSFDLAEGKATVITYSEELTDDVKVTPEITFTAGGKEYTKAMNEISVKVVNPEMTVKISAEKTEVEIGEEFSIDIYIENKGNAAFKTVTLYDTDGNKVPTEKNALEGGEYISATSTMSLDASKEIGFYVEATDDNGKSYTFNSNVIKIYASEPAPEDYAQVLKFEIQADALTEEGPASFTVNITNKGEVNFADIIISEAELGEINSFPTVKAGESKTFDFSTFEDITETTTFLFTLTAKDPDGNDVIIEADPIEVSIDAEAKKGGGIGGWIWVLVVIVVLIVGVGVTILVIMIRDKKDSEKTAEAAQKRTAAVQGIQTAAVSKDDPAEAAHQQRAKIVAAEHEAPQDLNSFGDADETEAHPEKPAAPARRVVKRRDFDDRNNF